MARSRPVSRLGKTAPVEGRPESGRGVGGRAGEFPAAPEPPFAPVAADANSMSAAVERTAASVAAKTRDASQALDDAETLEAGEMTPAGRLRALTPSMPRRATHPFGWSRRDLQRVAGLSVAGLVALVFLWQVQAILPPFVIAFFLASLLDPALRAGERHGRSRVRSIFTFYILALLIVVAFFVFIVPVATGQLEELSRNFSTDFASIQKSADLMLDQNRKWLTLINIRQHRVSDLMNGPLRSAATNVLYSMTNALQDAASKILWVIIIPISAFFFMRDYPLLRARLIALFPESHQDQIDVMSREIVDVFSAYLRGLAKICALYGIAAVLLFSLLGVRYALFLGMLAGLFYAIPYVGPFSTAVASGAIAYLMERHTVLFVFHAPANSLLYALIVVVSATVTQTIFDQILYPRVVGASVGLHPVVSIFALMAGATLFGIWGMLLAVPVAASIQILLTYFFPRLTQNPPPRLLDTPPPLA